MACGCGCKDCSCQDKEPQFIIRPSPIHGMGAFAHSNLLKDTSLGNALILNKVGKAGKEFKRTFLSKFINHDSKNNNIHLDQEGDTLIWVTTCPVKKYDELLTDYSHFEEIIKKLTDMYAKDSGPGAYSIKVV